MNQPRFTPGMRVEIKLPGPGWMPGTVDSLSPNFYWVVLDHRPGFNFLCFDSQDIRPRRDEYDVPL